MAEYYGKLKDYHDNKKGRLLKRISVTVFLAVIVILIAAVLAGIFGDTKRRDETREIVIENNELKERIFELSEENENLKNEILSLKKTLEQNSLNPQATLSKPEGDMSENASE